MFLNIFESFSNFIRWEMECPTWFSWFHIMWIVIIAVATFLLCFFFKDASDKTVRKIAFITWIIILTLEVIKQIFFYYSVHSDGTPNYYYRWYALPYQFCSSPLYVLPLIVFLKDGKLRDFAMAFMSLFVLAAGLSVIIYPGDVFMDYTYINIQTMIHHGSQVALGIFFIVYNRKKINLLYFLKSLPVFVVMAVIAMIINEIFPLFNHEDTLNCWFISRHFPCTLPVLSGIYPKVPYPVFLIIYFLGFGLMSFIVNSIALGIVKLTSRKEIA